MKLCCNCKYFLQIGSEAATCGHAPKADYVFGRTEYYHCSTERIGHTAHDCGPDAQFYVPKLAAA